MPERLRVAVVGLGWMGADHARVLAAHPAAELVAVVDADAERAAEVARTLGVRAAGALDEVLDEVDAVSVCTPDRTHEPLVLQALAARRAVLVEKPLATDAAAARRMVDAAWAEHALTVGHLLDVDPRVERARQVVRSGGIGDVWHVRIRRHAGRAVAAHVRDGSTVGWFGTIHDADLLLDLVDGEPAEVSATGVRGLVTGSWDVVDAVVRFDTGVYATLHESWTLAAGRPNRSDSGLAVVGSEGTVEVDLGHGQVLHATRTHAVAPDVAHYPSRTLLDSSDLQVELDRWVRGVLARRVAGVTGHRALRAVELVERIHECLER